MCLSWPRILVTAGTYSILRRNKVILSSLCQGSNRIDSFGFANFWFAKVNHFIFDSDSFWFTFKANESQWFILIQFDFDFDSLWFTIHLDFHSFLFAIQIDFIPFDSVWFWSTANHDSPANQNQIRSKIKGRWIVIHSFANHWLIRLRIKSESK